MYSSAMIRTLLRCVWGIARGVRGVHPLHRLAVMPWLYAAGLSEAHRRGRKLTSYSGSERQTKGEPTPLDPIGSNPDKSSCNFQGK